MRKDTALAVAVVVGFLIGSPVLVLAFHKPEAVGWGIDPWLLAGALVGGPGVVVASGLGIQNHVARLVVSFVVCWLLYGAICYLILLPFRRRT